MRKLYCKTQIIFWRTNFFPASGFGKFVPEEWDYKFGEYLKLDGLNKNE